MTIREWIARRRPQPPPALSERVFATLGDDADAAESRTAELCLTAAARSLDALLSQNRFGRGSALELLAVDALTTYAFEHASETLGDGELERFAERTARTLGQLMTQRV